MSQKHQKNLMVVGGVVVALVVGSVLLGGFTKSEPAAETTEKVGCPASGCDACPAAKTCGSEKAEGCSSEKSCPTDCQKACCAKACPSDCTKPCCAEEDPAGCCGEPKPNPCCGDGAEPAVQ